MRVNDDTFNWEDFSPCSETDKDPKAIPWWVWVLLGYISLGVIVGFLAMLGSHLGWFSL
jgi:hypothetical protein